MLPLAFVHLFWKKKPESSAPFRGACLGFRRRVAWFRTPPGRPLRGEARRADAGSRPQAAPSFAASESESDVVPLAYLPSRCFALGTKSKKKKMIAMTEGKERAPMFSSWSFMVSGLTLNLSSVLSWFLFVERGKASFFCTWLDSLPSTMY